MSQQLDGVDKTLIGAAAYNTTTAWFRIMYASASDTAALYNTTTCMPIGILQNSANVTAAGDPALVRVNGTSKVRCGASVTTGDLLMPNTAAAAILCPAATNTTYNLIGSALETGSTNFSGGVINLL